MKTDKIHFPSKNGTIDSELVKAIEALPEEMFILPSEAEKECIKKDGKILIYPHDPEQKLCILERIETSCYKESLAFTEFRIGGFEYKVLSRNPVRIYEGLLAPKKEPNIEIICKTLDTYHYYAGLQFSDIDVLGEIYTYRDWHTHNEEHDLVMKGINGLEKLCKSSDDEPITLAIKFERIFFVREVNTMPFKYFKEQYMDKARKIYLDKNKYNEDESAYKILDAGLKPKELK